MSKLLLCMLIGAVAVMAEGENRLRLHVELH